jgi:hypothetical protein
VDDGDGDDDQLPDYESGLQVWAALSKLLKLRTANISTVPDGPGLQFRSLVSLAASRQRRVEGSPLDAPSLQYLSVRFSRQCVRRIQADSPSIFDLGSFPCLEGLHIKGAGSFDECPIGGRSASVTSVTVEEPQLDFVCRAAFLGGFRDTVKRLTLQDVQFYSEDWEVEFPKLERLTLLGCRGLEGLSSVRFPALTRLSVKWGSMSWEEEQMGIFSILSAINGKDQKLEHLELNFEDSRHPYIFVMRQDLQDALTRLTELLSFHMTGCVVWSRSGWKDFACSNPHLRGVALAIGHQGVMVSSVLPPLTYY